MWVDRGARTAQACAAGKGGLDGDDNEVDDDPIEMEWDLTKDKKKDKPNPIKDEEDDSQTKLF